jgi:hypothetical protein
MLPPLMWCELFFLLWICYPLLMDRYIPSGKHYLLVQIYNYLRLCKKTD